MNYHCKVCLADDHMKIMACRDTHWVQIYYSLCEWSEWTTQSEGK